MSTFSFGDVTLNDISELRACLELSADCLDPTELLLETSNYDAIPLFIEFKADLESALVSACGSSDPKIPLIQSLIKYKAPLNIKGSGPHPLIEAVKGGSIPLVKYLLVSKAEVWATTGADFNKSSLHIAIENKNYDIAELLLQYKAKPNSKTSHPKTTFELAGNNLPMIQLLIRYKGSFDKEFGYRRIYESDDVEIQKFYAQRVSSQGPNSLGKTVLFYSKHASIIPDLIRYYRVDVNTRDNEGYTALHHARNLGVATALIQYKADINAISSYQESPLVAISRNTLTSETYNIIKLLLRSKANPCLAGASLCLDQINGYMTNQGKIDEEMIQLLISATPCDDIQSIHAEIAKSAKHFAKPIPQDQFFSIFEKFDIDPWYIHLSMDSLPSDSLIGTCFDSNPNIILNSLCPPPHTINRNTLFGCVESGYVNQSNNNSLCRDSFINYLPITGPTVSSSSSLSSRYYHQIKSNTPRADDYWLQRDYEDLDDIRSRQNPNRYNNFSEDDFYYDDDSSYGGWSGWS